MPFTIPPASTASASSGTPPPPCCLHQVGEDHVLHAEAQVGLVVAVLGHRLVEGHAPEGARDLDAQHLLPELDDEPLDDVEDVVLLDEAHLHVDLGELGLPVEAQVLVAEAADDLEVPVEAGDHVELLEELRALGQGVELARVEAAGDQEVAGPARRVLHHEGGLELEESTVGEVVAGQVVDPGPGHEGLLQRAAAQVEVAVLEPLLLGGVDLILDGEGRRLGAVEDLDLGAVDLDVAGARAARSRSTRGRPPCPGCPRSTRGAASRPPRGPRGGRPPRRPPGSPRRGRAGR